MSDSSPSPMRHAVAVAASLVSLLLLAPRQGSAQGDASVLVSSRGDAVVALSQTDSRVFARARDTMSSTRGMTFGPDGRLYVADGDSGRVVRLDGRSGEVVDVFIEDERLRDVAQVAFGPDGGLYVAAPRLHQVVRFDAERRVFDRVAAEGSTLDSPHGFVFDADGNLYVASTGSNAVLRYEGATGGFIDVFASTGLSAPDDLSFGPDGHLYVSSGSTGQVLRFDGASGALLDSFIDDPSLSVALGFVWGPDFGVYVAHPGGPDLRVFDAVTGSPAGVLRPSDDVAVDMTTPRFLLFERDGGPIHVESVRSATVALGFLVEGATPGGRVAVVFGAPAGETTLRECPGLRLNDIDVVRARIAVADGSGRILLSSAPIEARGVAPLSVQAVDLATCTPSEVLELASP